MIPKSQHHPLCHGPMNSKEHCSKELLDHLRFYLDLYDQYSKEFEARPLRNQLMNTESTDEVRALLDRYNATVDNH